jgi:hypothetical protein
MNEVSDQLLGRFTPFLLHNIYLSKEHHFCEIKNDPDWCSRWLDLADWQ